MPLVDRPWRTPAAQALRAERAARAAVRNVIGERASFTDMCHRIWRWGPIQTDEWAAYMRTGVLPRAVNTFPDFYHGPVWTPAELLAARKAELIFARLVTWRIRTVPGSCGRCRRASCSCETSHA